MKQKLFVLGLLLTFIVNVASAQYYTDSYENAWWAGDASEKDSRQYYDAYRSTVYSYPTTAGAFLSEPQALDLAKYDEAVNEINTYLGAYGDQMPAATKTALKATYDAAVAKERAIMLDWHTKVYFDDPGIANRYPAIKDAWDDLIATDAANLEKKLKTAKALTEAQILIAQVNATPETAFYGRNSGTNTGVWDVITTKMGSLSSAIDTYDALDQDDATAVGALANAVTALQNALATNDAACKEADQQLMNLLQIRKQVEAVLAANPAILSDESHDDLEAAYNAVATDLSTLFTEASALRYDRIGQTGDEAYNNQLLTETAKLTAALNKALSGSNADAFLPGTWTYGQPLPIVEPATTPYELTWGSYDIGVSTLKGLDSGISNLNSAVNTEVSKTYEDKEEAVKEEWNKNAFSDKYTTYTKPSQWKYNQTTWQAGIDQDVQDMRAITKLVNSFKELKDLYDAKKLTDTKILGAYATQYNSAVTAVEDLLGQSAGNFWNILLNERGDALNNINNVRAQFTGALNAIAEETADVKAANELLTAAIDQAKDVYGKLDENINAQATAKQQLKTAIENAEDVQGKVTGEKFNELQNAQDVTAAFNTLSAALTTALNGYAAAAPTPNVIDPTWIYDTPEYKGVKGTYTLDWSVYDQNLQDFNTFRATAASEAKTYAADIATKYGTDEGSAQNQWNSIPAWTDVTDDTKLASNWSYNQLTWQAGIDEDAAQIAKILSMLKQLEALNQNIIDAEKLEAKDILKEYATPIATAIDAAKAVVSDKKTLTKLSEKDSQDIMEAGVNLQAVLAANAEEIEDVQAAAEILRGNIATALGLIEKGYINEDKKAELQDKITDAQAVLDLVNGKDYQTINNSKTVTEQYTALSAYMAQAMQDIHLNHAPETYPAGGWVYSEPLSIGTASATAQILDWSKFDEAMSGLDGYKTGSTDNDLKNLVNTIYGIYKTKKDDAETQFKWVGAWPSSEYKSANNYEYNKDMWDIQIKQDADFLADLLAASKNIEGLYNAIQDATTLKNSTKILGAYKTALDNAITEAQTVHDDVIAAISENNVPVMDNNIKIALTKLLAIVKANTEETEDVKAADVLLAKAIEDAKRAKETVEDVDGGTAYQTNIQTAIDAAKTLYDLADGDDFTDATTPVVDAQTITDAIYTLNEAVAAQVLAYAGDITNINNVTTVDWAYAEPLRVGDNQDPAAQDTEGVTKYTLDWTKFDAALDELKNTNITAPEVLNIRDTYVVPAMETKEATAKNQWYNVPAWTGTNDKFVNQFQYNQTTWQDGINQDVAHIQNATKVLAELDKMYALNNKAEAHLNSEKMLQAAFLKNALTKALTASQKLYSDLTDGTVKVTEVKYAECEAAYEALDAAYNAAAVEEYRDVKTAQPLLLDAIREARNVAKTVENVDPKTYYTTIMDAAQEAENLLNQAKNDDFDGDADGNYVIKYAKTLTDAIRDLNKVVRDNVTEYNASIDNITPTEGWAYAQPLRLGKEKDPVAQDAEHNTVYTLDWTAFNKALAELQKVTDNTTYDKLKTRAQKVVDAFTAKQQTANTQWTSVEAWQGVNDKYVNQYQHNETTWNFGIANDAKTIANVTDLVIAMDSLASVVLYAKDNLNPAADNANVVSTFAAALQEAFDKALATNVSYLNKIENADATRYDVQVVDNATNTLKTIIAINEEEKADIDDYRPALWESYKVAQDIQKKIKDAAWTECYDKLGQAMADAKKVFDNANNHKYNEFKNAQEVTIARRALVLEMVKQQNAYADTINGLKDTLQQTIEDARAASLVVNVNNTYSTDLQNEIAAAYGMMSADPMLLPEDTQDLNLTKLQAEITRLKRIYCSAFILDLDSLKAAIADAQKFYDGITPFVGYKGVEKAQTDIKTAIETAQAFLTDAEAKNATQTSASDPYTPTFTDAATFNTYNTVDVPAATDALNKAHMAINLAALKAVSDSIKSYVDNEKVVTLYQNALNQVIDHANSVYGQYQPTANDKAAFSNFETQKKITDAIVTAIGDAQKFYAANDDAIAEAETVRTKLATKIADATTLKGELTDATSKNNLQTAITTATTLKNTDSASPEELTNGITALDLAMKTARWTDDIARLSKAIQTKEQERETLTDEDAKEIMALYINKAQALLAKLQASVYTTVTTAEVSAMITELGKGLTQAQTYNNGEMLPALLGKAKAYKDLIPTEYQEALDAQENSASLPYASVKAKGDALAEALDKAEKYTKAKEKLQTAINEAKLSENPTAEQQEKLANAETAVAAAFTTVQADLDAIVGAMNTAYNELKAKMADDRWSHQALTGKLVVKPWKPNTPNPGTAQYIKLVGKYTSADAEVANDAVDLFITNIQGTAGTRTFDWAPFTSDTDYKASIINLTSVGVSDFNNFKTYGWNYDEHYNDIIIKAGAIYSSGDGFVNANHAYGPFTWTNVWNQNDYDILDKNADGLYYGRYYTFKWSETNEGGVYRVPSILGIYDDTEDQFKVNGIKTYISKPNEDGSYFINSDLILDGDKGYDTEATVFNYENGTAILNGRWHRVQFINRDQFLYHQAAQKAADWYNNNPDLRHYDTAALIELKKAVESDNNKWETDAIEEAMKKVLDSYNKVNMIKGDNKYGVIATGDYADVQRTYTVTGAPDDAIDAKIIAQTENWTKDDAAYWQIVSADEKVGADSTATIVVKFNPGANYPADYREYQAILDVKVGNLNYQDEGKSNLQQAIYGANPKLSLKENELLQAHSLNLHRKDSITYDLYGRGYAHLYEKSPLTAKFYSATGLLLAESEVKTTLVKNQFTAYAADNDLDQTKFTVSYYPEDLGVDVVKVVISDTIRTADDIVLNVNAAKSQITFDPATVTDANQNSIKLDKLADGTDSYFFPADGETYFFPIAISNFDGVNANTKVVNEDGVISITTEVTDPTTGLVVEHERHDVQITIDNREYFTVETATTQINGTSKNIFVIAVKTDKLEQGTLDDGQHDGLLQIIWQDQDTINIHLNQTLPWFSAPTTAAPGAGPIVDSVGGNIEWEFTEDGDKIWYVDVNDVDNYYNYAVNFGAYTNTDWFIVDPAISYQLTPQRGTRKYRLKITYNPHEVNTVYTDVLTLNIFDTKRNVIVATTSINLKGDAVSSIKGGATGVNNAEVDNSKKDGKYFKNGKIVIVKGDQEFNASGAQTK